MRLLRVAALEIGLAAALWCNVDAMRVLPTVWRQGGEHRAGVLSYKARLGAFLGGRVKVLQIAPACDGRCRRRHVVRRDAESVREVHAREFGNRSIRRRLKQARGGGFGSYRTFLVH